MKENNIDLSFEMYEELKETIIKTIKAEIAAERTQPNDVPAERIERLMQSAELSREQMIQMLEQLRKHTALLDTQHTQEQIGANRYDRLLEQLASRLEAIDTDNRRTLDRMEQLRQAVADIDIPRKPPVQEHHHTFTLDIKSSKTALTMLAMAGIIILAIGFIYQVSMDNQQLAANDLKYRYVMMRGGIEAKELSELETIFRDDGHEALRDTVRNRVERYETAVRIRAEQLERATIKEREVERLRKEAEKLRGK